MQTLNDNKPELPGITVAPGVWVDKSALTFHFSRSGGPGGQNVNKLNTKAELRVRPEELRGLHPMALERLKLAQAAKIVDGELQIVADTERSQERNRGACMDRLRAMVVAAQAVPKRRKKTRPSRGSVEDRLQHKRERSEKKNLRRGGFD